MAKSPEQSRGGMSLRAVYQAVGFSKLYNFVLWFIFAGAMMGFILARLMYLSYFGVFCSPGGSGISHAAPGECYIYGTSSVYEIGIRMHLYTIIPAGFLAVLQFLPVLRKKVVLFHRINGYVILTLCLPAMASALMIARVAFGGGLEIQVAIGAMAIMFLGALGLALYNVKMLQIELHRAWMLRAWFYAASIITCRLIMILASKITSALNAQYYKAYPCQEVASFYSNTTTLLAAYPQCTDMLQWVAVKANMNLAGAEHSGASLNLSFGMGLWLALALHAIGVEVYVSLIPCHNPFLFCPASCIQQPAYKLHSFN